MRFLPIILGLVFGAILSVAPAPRIPSHPIPQTGPIGAPAPCAPCH